MESHTPGPPRNNQPQPNNPQSATGHAKHGLTSRHRPRSGDNPRVWSSTLTSSNTRLKLNVGLVALFTMILCPLTIVGLSQLQRDRLGRSVRSLVGLRPDTWLVADYLPPLIRAGNEWRFDLLGDLDGCSRVPLNLDNEFVMGQGYSKRVVQFGPLAMKRSLKEGRAIRECMNRGRHKETCWRQEVLAFVKEVGLMLTLQNDANIPRVYGYCIPTDPNAELTLMVELGEPLDSIRLVQMGWEQRLELIDQILGLLQRMWPLEPIDFRRQQFVLRNGSIPLLSDLDNITKSKSDLSLSKRFYHNFVKGVLQPQASKAAAKILARLRRDALANQLDLHTLEHGLQELKSFSL